MPSVPLRVEALGVFSFFAGWLTSELPVHHLAVAGGGDRAVHRGRRARRLAGPGRASASRSSRGAGWSRSSCRHRARARSSRLRCRTPLGDDYRAAMAPGCSATTIPCVRVAAAGAPDPYARPRGREGRATSTTAVPVTAASASTCTATVRIPTAARCSSTSTAAAWIIGDKREQGIPAHAPARVATAGSA